MRGTITEHFYRYDPEELAYQKLEHFDLKKTGFLIRLNIDPQSVCGKRNQLLTIPGMLQIFGGTYQFPEDLDGLSAREKNECYHVYTDEEGTSSYIEAVLTLYQTEQDTQGRTMCIGLPLKLYPVCGRQVYLLYDGVRLAWMVNGEIVNRDFTIGLIKVQDSQVIMCDTINAEITYELDRLSRKECTEVLQRSCAFYSARGYNTWAGDIVNFYHEGVYHFLVLMDRYHHGSRFGGGAHSAYHMTTRDFVHWENYGEIRELQYSWESFGTGTMFFHQGKYYYSYGLHTSRMLPTKQTGTELLQKQYDKTGKMHAVTYQELERQGLYPSGTNYLVSEDSVHFELGGKQVHTAENPSIYAETDGSLTMYAGYGTEGVWKSSVIDGPWEQRKSNMPGTNSSPVQNTTECPSIFEWNGYQYVLMGFRGYWQRKISEEQFTDLAAVGKDIYDGLCVPMVTKCEDRYILSGWVGGYGWAFVTQHRELIQHKDGSLGIRWLSEFVPSSDERKLVKEMAEVQTGTKLEVDERTSYYLECMVRPQRNGRVGVSFSGVGTPCVLELNSARKKVQITECEAPGQFQEEWKALYEFLPELPGDKIHTNSHDFAIAHVCELRETYQLRLLLHYEEKSDSLILDAEIGGGRTMISNRTDFRAAQIQFLMEAAEIRDLKLYEIIS